MRIILIIITKATKNYRTAKKNRSNTPKKKSEIAEIPRKIAEFQLRIRHPARHLAAIAQRLGIARSVSLCMPTANHPEIAAA